MYEPKNIISSAEEIRQILGEVFPSQVNKVIDHIDVHCRTWIERSPFIVVSSMDQHGRVDVSPKGDPPGFVNVLDEKTLAIPERPGNRRGDTFFNVLQNPRIGIMFVVPKRGEVLRVGGTAKIVRDPDFLSQMAVNARVPELALVVRVEEAMFHCGKSMIRSGMWKPERWGSIEDLPSYAQALLDHGNPPHTLEELEERVIRNEKERLY
jgi:PPOX class probable FMN-dependent enzyme